MEETSRSLSSIGELARLCGVTVRTLQYYDRNGLLRASYTEGGRRMYGKADVIRLQQILFLKSLGFPLEQIGGYLLKEQDAEGLGTVFSQQREILTQQMEHLRKMIGALDIIITETQKNREVSLERLMAILDLMKEGNPYTFILRYFNDEQFQSMAERFHSPEAYRSFMEHNSGIFAQVEELYRRRADPEGPEGQLLAKRWWEMVQEFAAGDPGMLGTLISSGRDMDRWPKQAEPIRKIMQEFLGPALNRYFVRNRINVEKLEGEKHE